MAAAIFMLIVWLVAVVMGWLDFLTVLYVPLAMTVIFSLSGSD